MSIRTISNHNALGYKTKQKKHMSDKLNAIGAELEKGLIPQELSYIKEFGKQLKLNPQKYKDLRETLSRCGNDTDRLYVLKGFAVSEDAIRKLIPQGNDPYALGTVTITITIITTLTPGTAH